ncbi:disease resistance protein RPP2B-like [Physcomitrium patens]|uniref:TIR domain-containing protein n=1 Tax=Physcomitrium patens TaxID=3218 RepID=A0A7I4EZX6_PHYPA|nr:disease resistance-like protein CSA1 [Physcomitrium patens]XP_024389455.1 disease resistance-like protein CSA1 [Physcomitrium patens]XP_024389456.1 disease resistance-like protein CSA1 [Physcomitrium patens]|eukprot:XP_024389454.1 disease resistance-like protein CSA1 [Physcomitrella patens]
MENKLGILDSKKSPDLDVRLDEVNEIPSIFSCHHPTEAKRSSFQLHETKHKIFLSHSGAEKSFVEQLCVDLERSGYFFPFFDQRSHSLPKGETFATLILQAAKQCHVAVTVLSKTFLTSKWPMIELGEFYKARNAGNPPPYLLPLFFKVSIKDLDEQSIEKLWMPTWEKFHAVDKRIDLGLWKRAVKALSGTNGFIFEQAKPLESPPTGIVYRSEVDYRSAAREEIQRLSPPDLLYGSRSTMVGYERLCQILSSQFVEENETGLLLLGLYGMPGLGKTTMSKAISDYFQTEFGMTRVCRLELSNVSTTRSLSQDEYMKRKAEILMHQKEVLNKLWCGGSCFECDIGY